MRLRLIRPRVQLRSVVCGAMLALAVLGHASLASAATLTWGTTGTGGGGTWTTTNAWWNGTTQQTWNNATPDDAVFGGTGGAVALAGGTTTVGGITFNTFTGSYTIGTASQTLVINGGITMNSGAGAVTIQNSPITLGAAQSWTNDSASLFTASSNITNGGNLLTVAGSGNATLSGSIAGAGGITKTGNGTLTLSGVNTSYSGTTTVNGGLVTSNPATTGVGLSSFGTGPIVIGSSGTVRLTGSNGQASPNSYYASGYTNTVSGSGTLQLVGQNTGFSVNYSGDLSGFTGTVSATAATGNFVGFGSSTNPSLSMTGSNAKFVVSGAGTFVGVLSASGTIALGELSGNGTIWACRTFNTTWEIGNLSTSSTFSGAVRDNGVPGLSSLRKIGSGTLTLSGSSSYTGGTQLIAGGLTLGNPNALGAATNSLAVNGGTLNLAGQSLTVGLLTGSAGSTITSSTAGAVTFTASSASSGTYGGSITAGLGTVALAKAGAGTLTLSGSNSYTGNTTISQGVLSITGTSALPGWDTAGRFSVASGAGLAVGDAVSESAVSTLVGTGNFAANSFIGFDTTAGRTQASPLTGAIGLVKLGSGTLTLSGSNSYTGSTTISAGVLQVGSGGSTGSVSDTSPVSVSNGATLAFNRSDALTYGGTVSGAGGLTKLGSGTLSLTGSNSYTGATTISAGVLQIGTGGTTGSLATASAVSVASGATLVFNRSDALTYGGTVSGAGSLLKLGSNTLTLSSSNTFAGGAAINDGLVIGSSRSSFGTGTISLGASGTAQLTAAASGVSAHPVPAYYSNGYTNAVTGSGVLRLVSGATTYSVNYSGDLSGFTGTVSATNASGQYTGIGNTTNPALNLTGSNTKFFVTGPGNFLAILTSSGTIVMGELSGDGIIVATNSASAGLDTTWQIGSLATSSTYSGRFLDNNQAKSILAKVGSGTLTLSGSNSYTGGTLLNAGGLTLGNPNALGPTTNSLAVNGGTLNLAGQSLTVGLLTGSSGGTITSSTAGAITFTANSASSGTYGGSIADGLGTVAFTKAGSGTLTLSGSNAYTGATQINAGVLSLGNSAALGTTGTISFGSGTLQFSASNTADYSGRIASSASAISIDTNSQNVTFASSMGFTNTGGLTKLGSGTLTLSGSNSYTGGTRLNAGGLTLGNPNALGSSTNSLAVNGGTLDLAGQSITVGLFTGSAGSTITSSQAGAMTFTASSASSGTYGGSITNG
ncbi:MAG: autotransporter-associated beta strand repeat-containing protein, partial [Pirellulales bacterium]